MIRDEWFTWVMLLIAVVLYILLLTACAAPEQPITAYRQSFQMIDNIYVRQAEIEELMGYSSRGGYAELLQGKENQ